MQNLCSQFPCLHPIKMWLNSMNKSLWFACSTSGIRRSTKSTLCNVTNSASIKLLRAFDDNLISASWLPPFVLSINVKNNELHQEAKTVFLQEAGNQGHMPFFSEFFFSLGTFFFFFYISTALDCRGKTRKWPWVWRGTLKSALNCVRHRRVTGTKCGVILSNIPFDFWD